MYCFVDAEEKVQPRARFIWGRVVVVPCLTCGAGRGVSLTDTMSMTHLHLSPRVWRISILGAHTGAAAICLAPGLEHPGIRDPRRSQDCKKGVSYCKHRGSGIGDKLCTPMQGEVKMLGLGRGGEAESGAETQALGKEGPRELQPHWHRTGDSLAERGGRKGPHWCRSLESGPFGPRCHHSVTAPGLVASFYGLVRWHR